VSYLAIRDSAVEQIKAGLLPLWPRMRVEAHPGVFTEQSIRKDARRAPAVLTSLVRAVDGVYNNGVTFVSWVLYRASSEDLLYDGALRIISALIPVIRNAEFPLAIKDVRTEAECLYTGSLDAINVTMWAVRWELVLGDRAFINASPDGLGDFDGADGTVSVGTVEI
jgi:hypothetical protein